MKSRKGCVIGTSLYNEKYCNSAFKLSADTRKAMADAGPGSKARGMVAEAEATGRIAEEVEKTGEQIADDTKKASFEKFKKGKV